MKRFWGILFLLFVCRTTAYAWWSVPPAATHKGITEEAISVLDPVEYRDIRRFSSQIIAATYGSSNDYNAHGKILENDSEEYNPLAEFAGKFNGGPFELWQNRAYRYGYLSTDEHGYSGVYYIGLMAHLVQDQAVPAHAANLSHLDSPDGLEKATGLSSWIPGSVVPKSGEVDPLAYYYHEDDKDYRVFSKVSG